MRFFIYILFLLGFKLSFFAQEDTSATELVYSKVICLCSSDAKFVGGQNELTYWVQNHLNYPELAIKYNERGKVYVTFIVNEDGALSDIKIIRGVSQAIDNEVIRLIKKMPDWIAAEEQCNNVKTKILMAIEFKLF